LEIARQRSAEQKQQKPHKQHRRRINTKIVSIKMHPETIIIINSINRITNRSSAVRNLIGEGHLVTIMMITMPKKQRLAWTLTMMMMMTQRSHLHPNETIDHAAAMAAEKIRRQTKKATRRKNHRLTLL